MGVCMGMIRADKLIAARNAALLAEFNGSNHAELAVRYKLAENSVYKIIAADTAALTVVTAEQEADGIRFVTSDGGWLWLPGDTPNEALVAQERRFISNILENLKSGYTAVSLPRPISKQPTVAFTLLALELLEEVHQAVADALQNGDETDKFRQRLDQALDRFLQRDRPQQPAAHSKDYSGIKVVKTFKAEGGVHFLLSNGDWLWMADHMTTEACRSEASRAHVATQQSGFLYRAYQRLARWVRRSPCPPAWRAHQSPRCDACPRQD